MKDYIIKYSSKVIVTLVLVLLITSCNTYKNLEQAPKIKIDGDRLNEIQSTDTLTVADSSWTSYFEDVQLKELISTALENNIDLQISITRIKRSEAGLRMSKLSLYPNLSAGLESNLTFADKNVENYTLGFRASWELDLWGKLNNQTKAKYASLLNTYEYKKLIQTQIIANIANAYYRLLSLDKQLEVTKRTILILQKNAETMDALKQAGQQNAAGVSQSYALLYSTQTNIPQLESQIREQENIISLLLGREPGRIERTNFDSQKVKTELSIGIPAIALSKRPDIRQSQLDVQKAFANTKAAKADLYPSIKITSATAGNSSNSFSELFKFDNIAANLVAGITQPIFNRGQIKGNIKVAEADQEEALLNFKNSVLKAAQEVSDILFGLESSLNKNEFRERQIESLSNSVEFTQELLIAGEANYTEVLTAQQNLLLAQLSQINDKLDQLIYGVNLYKALGGGL
ncbi:MAG: efflux transporter outer membrane subunit [Bacteroidales bacterium]|jgi:NodT family efflux transporter outer membrane factor (OMF) lipoprotein|nr:efflux transporter outer membrane subunit [Bacteroidales bacterium]